MKLVFEYNQGSEAWHKDRAGKTTSTGAKSLVGYKDMLKNELVAHAVDMKLGVEADIKKMKVDDLKKLIIDAYPTFEGKRLVKKVDSDYRYRILAHELSDGTAPDEDPRERGHRLEPENRDAVSEKIGKPIFEVGFAQREDEPRIAMSPDGVVGLPDDKVFTEMFEGKSLAGWKHVKAWLENEIPKDMITQGLQYFVVNDDLETLYFSFYCPEIKTHPLHIIPMTRAQYADQIQVLLDAQMEFWAGIDKQLKEIYFN